MGDGSPISGIALSPLQAGHYDLTGYHAQGYQSAQYARENQATLAFGSADYQMRYDRYIAVAISRQMDQDNWLYEALFNRADDYVLGPAGFGFESKCSNKRIRNLIEKDLWPRFRDNPEVTDEMNFRDCESVSLREAGVAGDSGWIELGPAADKDAGKLQHIESERIITSRWEAENHDKIEQGVQLSRTGKRVAYWIADVDRYGWVMPSTARPVAARDFHYVPWRIKRSSSTRRMPALQSSIPLAHMLGDILQSEAVSWQVLSRLVATLKREVHETRPTFRDGKNASIKPGATAPDGQQQAAKLMTDLGMALLFQAGPKDELSVITQNRPGTQFEPGVLLYVRCFCASIGLPMEVVLLNWLDANYSNARAILLTAFLSIRLNQLQLVSRFHTPVVRRRVGHWIAEGKCPWQPDVFDHGWDLPELPMIDEDKEVSAKARKLDRMLQTHSSVLSGLQIDRDEQLAKRVEELKTAAAAAQEVEKSTGGLIKATDVWRHLSGLDTGKTLAAVNAAGAGADADGKPSQEGAQN